MNETERKTLDIVVDVNKRLVDVTDTLELSIKYSKSLEDRIKKLETQEMKL